MEEKYIEIAGWLTSKTLVGVVVALIGSTLTYFNVKFDSSGITEIVTGALTLAGLVLAFYGRLVAKERGVKRSK